MKLTGSVIKEQGVTFGVFLIKPTAFNAQSSREDARVAASAMPMFRNIPLVLASQDHRGRVTYSGRRDLVDFLANVPVSAIPWKEYTVN